MRDAVVLPVYNEARTVASVLEAVRRVFEGTIIVVDDGSTDGTSEALRGLRDVLVLCHDENRGYGRSLIDGFEAAFAAGVERIVTMDCDGQHEPAHIPSFLDSLEDCDIASGSRYLPGSRAVGAAPRERVRVNAAGARAINEVTGRRIAPTPCAGWSSQRTGTRCRWSCGPRRGGADFVCGRSQWSASTTTTTEASERISTTPRSAWPTT